MHFEVDILVACQILCVYCCFVRRAVIFDAGHLNYAVSHRKDSDIFGCSLSKNWLILIMFIFPSHLSSVFPTTRKNGKRGAFDLNASCYFATRCTLKFSSTLHLQEDQLCS